MRSKLPAAIIFVVCALGVMLNGVLDEGAPAGIGFAVAGSLAMIMMLGERDKHGD